MKDRREFLRFLSRTGLAAASAPLWSNAIGLKALAQSSDPSYKAVVVITLMGGNDGNNTVVPIDNVRYPQYASLRGPLAIPQGSCIPLKSSGGSDYYGLHPSLKNIAAAYNNNTALVVANVGPLNTPGTKKLQQAIRELPQELLSHPAGVDEWESASGVALPSTGWGGRLADRLMSYSGSLPPLLDAATSSIFAAGEKVQAIAVRPGGHSTVLPPGINDAILKLATIDSKSNNQLVAQAGMLSSQAGVQQAILDQAQSAGSPLKTRFPGTLLGQSLQTIANTMNGRSIIGASRQIFYTQQLSFDTHTNQAQFHANLLSDLDSSIGSMTNAAAEMGIGDRVLTVTLSDFNRTMQMNENQGSDHGWGNHQFLIGGGIKGGRVLGTFPDLDLGGEMDWTGSGVWIPSLSVSQMVAGIGTWLGLSTSQVSEVFPDLSKFPGGPLSYFS